MVLPSNPDPISTHNEYLRLLRDYLSAKKSYQVDSCSENWQALQQATIELKKHNDKRDGYGFQSDNRVKQVADRL